jgi:hypothetical protein
MVAALHYSPWLLVTTLAGLLPLLLLHHSSNRGAPGGRRVALLRQARTWGPALSSPGPRLLPEEADLRLAQGLPPGVIIIIIIIIFIIGFTL